MARPHIEPFVDRDVPFKRMTLPGFPEGYAVQDAVDRYRQWSLLHDGVVRARLQAAAWHELYGI